MSYVVRSTEKVRGIGAEYETRALLYLMSGRKDSHEIFYFAIDFFNDVTGLNSFADKAWDVQSKGAKNASAKAIGRELVTLFKNYMSSLKFDYLILFIAGVPDSFRIDSSLNTFGIENVREKAINSVREGLIDECKKRDYIENDWATNDNISTFMDHVSFVIDDKSKAEYIKSVISINPKFIPQDDILDGIFNNIRDAQSSKKNNESVEGEVIEKLGDVWTYDRVLSSKEIRLMVLNTLINGNLINNGIPVYFIPVIEHIEASRKKYIVEDCQLAISTTLFNKDNADRFWDLLDIVSAQIEANPSLDTNSIYDLVSTKKEIRIPGLNILSVKYLISVMKEALQ